MMQTFYPGTYFKEVEFGGGAKSIAGIDMSIGAMVGYFEKGPIGVPVLVTELNRDIFGGPVGGSYGWYALDGFFKNGGRSIYVIRTAHYSDPTTLSSITAVSSTITLRDRATVPTDTLKVSAKNQGVWGNKISIKIIDDPIINTTVQTEGAMNTKILQLKSVYGIKKGMTLIIGDKTAVVDTVDDVTRNVTFVAQFTSAITAQTVVKSNEFRVIVLYNDAIVETFGNLSLIQTNQNYVETIINDEAKGSKYITVEDMLSVSPFPTNIPAVTATSTKLLNGNDGLTGVVDADIIGTKASKNGIYALDYIQDSFNLITPESCSEDVKRASFDYCSNRMDCFAIGSIPEAYTVEMAKAYRLESGNFNTSYGALYYSWGYVTDPIGVGSKPEKLVPLDGHIAGMYARNDRDYSVGQVPAGEQAVLKGVNRLEHKMDDVTNGILNTVNVNCIRSLSGAGIVVWGARTLSSDTQWTYINARRIFIYVEKSVMLGTRWVIFRGSNPNTWKSIKRTVDFFLNTVPGLYGDTPEERYKTICDETTNPESIRRQGQVICKIGLNVESVGEFLIFEIGQMREGVSLTE